MLPVAVVSCSPEIDVGVRTVPKEIETCCVCGRNDATSVEAPLTRAKLWRCRWCGEFYAHSQDETTRFKRPHENGIVPAQLSALIREHNLRGRPPVYLQFDDRFAPQYDRLPDAHPVIVSELLRSWPRDFAERMDRVLCNLVRAHPEPAEVVQDLIGDPTLVFAENKEQVVYTRLALVEFGWLRKIGSADFEIAPLGWKHYSEITRRTGTPDDPVFVAMWFGGDERAHEMREVYLKGMEPAVQQAKYRVKKADSEPHNEWIMNQVLGDIRVAPFVVADFTGNAKGVYYEAGFAKGLGKTVIHTCKASDFGEEHFDTKQINHVLWDSPEDLRVKLREHIRGTIGEGPSQRAD